MRDDGEQLLFALQAHLSGGVPYAIALLSIVGMLAATRAWGWSPLYLIVVLFDVAVFVVPFLGWRQRGHRNGSA